MKHKLFEVFKHPAPYKGLRWAVQGRNTVLCFRTKCKAAEVAANLKTVSGITVIYAANSGAFTVTIVRRIENGIIQVRRTDNGDEFLVTPQEFKNSYTEVQHA